jgi:hypothetical protein
LGCELPYYTLDQIEAEARRLGVKLPHLTAINFYTRGYCFLETIPATLSMKDLLEIYEWCLDQFGDRGYNYHGRVFAFLTAQEALMFKLRWGC